MIKSITLLTITVLLLFVSCNNKTKQIKSKNTINATFNQVLEDYYQDGLRLQPLSATYIGDNRYNNKFPNTLSDEYKSELKDYYSNYLEVVSHFNDEDLSESEKLSKAVLKWECDINLSRLTFRQDLLPIDQMWSVNLTMGQLGSGASAQPFNTVDDYNNWLQRLDEYLIWMSYAETRMKEGIELGYVLPKSLIIKVLPQLEAVANDNLDQNLFYNPVKNFPENFSESDKKQLTISYTKMLKEKLIPSYKSLHKFMSTDYLNAGRETSGFDDIPNGKEYYDYQIKFYTTTNMTADEIHQLGLKEVARILSEMEKVKAEVGFKNDLKSFFDYVRNNKELMPFTEPQQVIDNFNKIHETMKPQIDELFDLTPNTVFEVRRTETFREKSASAEYNSGSLDGTRPGIFYVPIPNATEYNSFSDESLFLHEAIPGHHYQISLTQENENLPNFRKTMWNSGYGEGWALYTESLGKELGLFTDPYQYFGMLSAEMHRAIRLVVDTGIHTKDWTREEAIQYSLDNGAESEAGIISEIERYMANPGQALSYKIGQLTIRELRTKAENVLGDKFDIRQFHNQVLESGAIPLAILEEKISNWIATYN